MSQIPFVFENDLASRVSGISGNPEPEPESEILSLSYWAQVT